MRAPGSAATVNPRRPITLWVADCTYVPAWAGMGYVAFVIDAGSRRITLTASIGLSKTELINPHRPWKTRETECPEMPRRFTSGLHTNVTTLIAGSGTKSLDMGFL